MKLALLLLLTAVSPALAGDLLQTNAFEWFKLYTEPPKSDCFLPASNLPWNTPPHRPHIIVGGTLTNLPVPIRQGNRFQAEPSTSGLPAPGLYQTFPYSGLVLATGGQGGDQFVRHPSIVGLEKMPMWHPDIQFIPYQAGTK
jgi:hypothetical protein